MMSYFENFPELEILHKSLPDHKQEEKMSEEIDYILFRDVPIKKLIGDNPKPGVELRNYLCKAKMSDRFYLFTKINWDKLERYNYKAQVLQDQLITL